MGRQDAGKQQDDERSQCTERGEFQPLESLRAKKPVRLGSRNGAGMEQINGETGRHSPLSANPKACRNSGPGGPLSSSDRGPSVSNA